MKRKRLPLPKRFNVALTDDAYAQLRSLNKQWGLGNNYLLVVLLEHLHDYAESGKLEDIFRDFIDEYSAPATNAKTTKSSDP